MISTRCIPTWARNTLALLLLTGASSVAAAQTLNCRYDYSAARKESLEKNQPLLLEFSTENCLWCKKLDNTTFRDPALIAWLNERIVILRLDAEREPRIAQALKITNYPTLILAAPNGNILTIIEGYMEAPKLQEHLQKILAPPPAADEALARSFQDATTALAQGDNPRALALLKSILDNGANPPIQVKAKDKLRELEQQAQGQMSRARGLVDKGQPLEALETLTTLTRNYPGTPAELEAKNLNISLSAKPEIRERQRARRAAELLGQAKEEFRLQQYGGCLDKCELIAGNYADLPEGVEATQLVAEIKRNPEYLGKACQNLHDRLSNMYLALADAWLAKGNMEQAIACLEKVQRDFAGTQCARAAQVKLTQIRAQNDQRTDFKKQP